MIYLSGPGHGGNAMVAQDWLDGTYTEVYPNITQDEDGMKKLFKQFSFPGGVPSHVAPETPAPSTRAASWAILWPTPSALWRITRILIAACVVGDGEAETGPLATSWHGNKFMNPITDGAVLPILHLNGFKIANPTIFSRMTHEEVESFFRAAAGSPCFVEGSEPEKMHQKMAATLDWAIREIKRIQEYARTTGDTTRPRWPMIVLRTPKGWTGPQGGGRQPRGRTASGPIRCPSPWAPTRKSICPIWSRGSAPIRRRSCSTRTARRWSLIASFPPAGTGRMGANPHANGGLLLRDLRTPDFRDYAVDVPPPARWRRRICMVWAPTSGT